MMKWEIERKFLVKGDTWRGQGQSRILRQGYLARTADRVVRVRQDGDQGFLTIKIRSGTDLTRSEFEYEIPLPDALALIDSLAPGEIIEKKRHVFNELGMLWEVDEYSGANSGLIVAEVELESEDQPFAKPDWLGEEVSRISRYLNVELAAKPYMGWKEEQHLAVRQV